MPPTTFTPRSRAGQVRQPVRRAIQPVLREGDELQVQPGGDDAPDLQQRLNAEQPVVGRIHVAADRQQPHRDGPVAVGQRPVAHLFGSGRRAQLAPERDALEQGAGGVDPRQAVAEGRVHVEMRVDERRADEVTGRVDDGAGFGAEASDGGDAVALNADVGDGAVGQRPALHQDVEGHQRSPRL
jgi:hypothetical protein